VSLKQIMRDNEIQISYKNTLLVFSFIMGAYYLSVVLQMSKNLPIDQRKPFEQLLSKFSTEFMLYTFDCFFVLASLLGALLIWFNIVVKKATI
jgi:hypothetical protein